MKKNISIVYASVFLLTVFISSSCNTTTPPTMSLYNHYISPAELNLHLEFDYPSFWVLEEITEYANLTIISLLDPQSSSLLTPPPSDGHLPEDDLGSVSLIVRPLGSEETSDTEIESFKQGIINTNWRKVINDYKTKVAGYDARVLEYQIKSTPEGYSSLMLAKRTVFMYSGQLYIITLTIAEKDKGGEFEQGYEYFFNSLKILP